MPDVKPHTLPSMEGLASQQADLQAVCTGRRRTCALLNTPSPCASSAICHIQDIRSRLKIWFQKPRICRPEIDPDNPQNSETVRLQGLSLKVLDSDSTDLYVEGIAITARGYQKSPLQKKIEDVLSEVMHLVERLEADRQFAEEALQKEKRIRSALVSKTDGISLWKLSEHPAIIQKEHEACSRDIAELKWQLKLENQKVDEVQEKLLQAELLNQKLQEDIEFARNQIPIVTENIDRQKGVIHLLGIAQAEADDIQASTKQDLLQIEMELRKMETEADLERMAHEHRHEEKLHELDDRLKELNRLKMHKKNLLTGIKKTKETILHKEKKQRELVTRLPEIAKLEKMEEDKISHLNLEIENKVKINQQLGGKLMSIKAKYETRNSICKAELTFTTAHLHSRNEALEALLKENKDYEQKIDDYKTKICKSEKDVKQMRAETKLMLQKITDDDEHWEKAKEELTEVTEQNSNAKAKLDFQESLIVKEDHDAMIFIESLRKELTHRLSTIENLKRQVAEINLELKEHEERSQLTNRGLQKEFDESYSATQALEAKVKRMKELVENFEKIQSEHEEALADLEKDTRLKRDQLKAATDLHGGTLKRIKDNNARCTVLMNKSKEYQESSHEMEKYTEDIPKIIAELEKDLDVVDFKNKSAAHTVSTLQSDINNWQLRTQRLERTSLAHLKERRKLAQDTKGLLEVERAENERLAIEYKGLKKMLLEARQESVSVLRVKNHAHKRCSYYTELSLLQKRMHKVLVKYLEQRSLRFLVDLEECQTVARKTSQKITTAQGKLSKEIQLLSAFLQSVRESSTTTKNAEKSKQTSPDASEVNEQKPPVQVAV
ncbi:coiled-coil domain-containing protein 178 isoform X1 [Xiphophorus couchianus]|nr:coiled-coil domain-containing protein 178 isoform X1 [Xiphophorus couchianus]XP_027877274.1 coiled-coil domain-containing protein 178 isoform X1 [Xiphophorus couchianus]